MPTDDRPPLSERSQTNESLRVEREKADHALDDELAAIDETADAVISRARARADLVLAAARAKTDRQLASSAPGSQSPAMIERERGKEDQALREERAAADRTVRAERAEHIALLSIDRRVTDKDLFSERARSDDALATRDEFLGVVSHDLRNMLTTMVGFAGIIAEGVAKEPHLGTLLTHAQRIQRAGARMNRLIGDLVDVASIEAGALAVTRELGDPTQVVTEAVDSFQTQAAAGDVSLGAEIASPLSLAAFDPARILQVLINLISNALKFTPPRGSVMVRVDPTEEDICFAVCDTGMGIPPDKLEAVFERFLQISKNDRRGLGLGLYISKCIVQGHGGRIWVESTFGQGSTFRFTLPRSSRQGAAPPPSERLGTA